MVIILLEPSVITEGARISGLKQLGVKGMCYKLHPHWLFVRTSYNTAHNEWFSNKQDVWCPASHLFQLADPQTLWNSDTPPKLIAL